MKKRNTCGSSSSVIFLQNQSVTIVALQRLFSCCDRVAQDELDLDLIEDEDAVDSFVDTQIKKGIAAAGHPDAPRTHRKKQRHYEASVHVSAETSTHCFSF